MEEKVVRKTTAKRTMRKAVGTATVARTTVRKTGEVSSLRKAPVRVLQSGTNNNGSKSIKILSIGVVLFTLLIGVSALIGMSDKGQLDVASVIAERKQRATPEEKQVFDTVPTQQSQANIPNGGLVGMGQEAPKPPVVEVVSTTTEATASSSGLDISSSTAEEEDTTQETSL